MVVKKPFRLASIMSSVEVEQAPKPSAEETSPVVAVVAADTNASTTTAAGGLWDSCVPILYGIHSSVERLCFVVVVF